MSMTSVETAVNLDSLNPKQQAKEYKSASKEIKAKDPAKQMLAVQKFKDERYLLEGGCLIPLIEAMVPKKKNLESTKVLLETLLSFLAKEKDGVKLGLAGVRSILTLSESLSVLQIVADIIIYEDETKVKKKKNEIEPPVDPTPEIIRYSAMRALALVANAITTAPVLDEKILSAFANIPSLAISLCKALTQLSSKLKSPNIDQAKCIAGCGWVLEALIIVLKYGKDSISTFLSFESLSDVISSLWAVESLTLMCLLVVQLLSTTLSGLSLISSSEYLSGVLAVCIAASNRVESALVIAPSGAAAKGGKGKDVKGKGKSQEAPAAVNTPNDLSLLAVGVKIFSAVAQRQPQSISLDCVTSFVKAVAVVVLNQMVWITCSNLTPFPANPDLSQFIHESVVLIGYFGLISAEVRGQLANNGGTRLLINLLRSSVDVLGLAPPAEPPQGKNPAPTPAPIVLNDLALAKLHRFRNAIEKALLNLLTSSAEQSGDEFSPRWKSCASSEVDQAALRSIHDLNELPDPPRANIGLVVDMMRHSDPDLSSRACRLFTLSLQSRSTENPVSLLKSLQLDGVAIGNLSASCLKHAGAYTNEIEAEMKVRASAALSKQMNSCDDTMASQEAEETKAEDELVVIIDARSANDAQTTDAKEKLPLLSSVDSLCHCLLSLEYFLQAEPSYITVFATQDQINLLSGLLYMCGPANGKFLRDPHDINIDEVFTPLLDPRNYNWEAERENENPPDAVILREIIFDIFSIVVSADGKYRVFSDTQPPQQPCAPFPPSTSPCVEESLRVIRACSNPCIATLQCRSSYKVEDGNVVASPVLETQLPLSKEVCDSALRLVESIARVGVRGLDAFYTSLAKNGFARNEDMQSYFVPALKYLKDFMAHKVLPLQPVGTEPSRPFPEAIDANYLWNFPLLFELSVSNDRLATHSLEILYQKEIWPFVAVAGALLGIVASPSTDPATIKLALLAVSSFSNVSTISPMIQPAVVDLFSASVLGLGGLVILGGVLGRFGPLYHSSQDVDFVTYLVKRGVSRETFWNDLKQQKEAQQAELQDAKGKGGKKDTKGKDKGKDLKKKEEELTLPFEPDPTHPDPNHGPDSKLWASYINTRCDDLHSSAPGTGPLNTAIQGDLSTLALTLIEVGVDINQQDASGLCPLNHCLLLGEREVAMALIAAGVLVDQVDDEGNPTVKYAFFSLSKDSLSHIFEKRVDKGSDKSICLWGSPFFVDEMIGSRVDLNVCDLADGNSPLHYAIGLGTLRYAIGGVLVTVSSDAHTHGKEISLPLFEFMVAAGANINTPNKNCITSLHVLAALGDVNAVNSSIRLGAVPNAQDNMGFLPIHYAASCCSLNAIKVARILLEQGVLRPVFQLDFNDDRTGKVKEEKYQIDSKKVLDRVLADLACPQVIGLRRLSRSDILKSRSKDGLSPSLLALCGGLLSTAPQHRCLAALPVTSTAQRIEMFFHLSSLYDGNPIDLIAREKGCAVCPAHALSLLLLEAKDEAVTAFGKIKSVLQDIFDEPSFSIDEECNAPVRAASFPKCWTVLHTAIASDCEIFLDFLVNRGISFYKFPYIHFLASQSSIDERIMRVVALKASSTPVHGSLLNVPVTSYPKAPLHIAIEQNNSAFVRVMLEIPQVDPNIRDERTGQSPLHLACALQLEDVVNKFVTANRSIDLLIADHSGNTCLDVVISQKNVILLNALLAIDQSAAVQRILEVAEDGQSTLTRLENEHLALCRNLGIVKAISPEEQTLAYDTPDVIVSLDSAPSPPSCVVKSLRSAEELGRLEVELQKNGDILTPIISLLKELGLGDESLHTHASFFDGQLYRDYCRGEM